MWKTKCFVYSIVLISVLLTFSCSSPVTSNDGSLPIAESTTISTKTPENTAIAIPLPTETKSVSTLTPLPLIKTNCIKYPSDTHINDLSGVVALEAKTKPEGLNLDFFLLDLKNRNTIRTINEGVYNQISPDRKHLTYRYRSHDKDYHHLAMIDSNGKTIADFPLSINGKWQSFFSWQNATQLRMLQQEKDWKVTVNLLDPFTQEHSVLSTDWSEVYKPKNPFYDKQPQWKFDQNATEIFYVYGANILYDPTLTRVFYPKDNGVVSLVNVDSRIELASSKFNDWGKIPSWSPDGQYLTILNREKDTDEFYLISRDGNEFQKITNFASELDLATISEYSWSPNSKQIAFWLNSEKSELEDGAQSELAILDIASKQVTRLCIQGISRNAFSPWTMNHPEPIWSPDGRYLMFAQWDDPTSPKKYDVIVVDPQTGAIEKVSENTAPIGWMSGE